MIEQMNYLKVYKIMGLDCGSQPAPTFSLYVQIGTAM